MEYVKITRFSYDGFYPQNQDAYIKEKLLKEQDITNKNFNNGVWVFVKGYEDKYLLNHLDLDDIPYLNCYEAQIPVDTVVFKHDNPYEISAISTVKEEMHQDAFFIPESSLNKLIDIRKTYNRFSE